MEKRENQKKNPLKMSGLSFSVLIFHFSFPFLPPKTSWNIEEKEEEDERNEEKREERDKGNKFKYPHNCEKENDDENKIEKLLFHFLNSFDFNRKEADQDIFPFPTPSKENLYSSFSFPSPLSISPIPFRFGKGERKWME